MVKRWRYILPALLLVLLLGLVVTGYGLLHSEGFARRLVQDGLVRVLPGASVASVEGTLVRGLDLTALRLPWPDGVVTVEQLSFRWQLAELLQARIHVTELRLVGVTVALRGESQTPGMPGASEALPAWPVVRGWPLRLQVLVDRLQCERMQLVETGAPLLKLETLSGALEWRQGFALLRDLAVTGPEIALNGEARVGLEVPRLQTRLQGRWSGLPSMLQQWEVQADLEQGESGPTGAFQLVFSDAGEPTVRLQGQLAIVPGQLLFEQLQLERPGHGGAIAGEAQISFAGPEPLLKLTGRIKELDLADLIGQPTRLNGTVEVTGAPRSYQGRFDLRNDQAGWRQLAAAGEFQGDLDGLTLIVVDGTWLRGTLRGDGRLRWSEPAACVAQLQLERPGHGGSFEGEAQISFAGPEPLLNLVGRIKELDLADLIGQPTRLNGTVEVTGAPRSYRGRFDLRNDQAGWRQLAAAGEFQGDLDGLTLTVADGAWLRGTLRGEGRLRWSDPAACVAQLQLRGLDPATLDPALSGRLATDVQLRWVPTAGLSRLELSGTLLPSRLAERDLAGTFDLTILEDDLRISALDLHGPGFSLTGSGQLREELRLALRVDALQSILPIAAGGLTADARVRFRASRWSGDVVMNGRQLRWRELAVGLLQLNGSLDPGGRFQLVGEAKAAQFGEVTLDGATWQATGTVADHHLQLHLAGAPGQLDLTAAGGYSAGTWNGRLLSLSGADNVAPWKMSEPAPLQIDARHLAIPSLRLREDGGETLDLGGEWTFATTTVAARGRWNAFQLARLAPLVPFPLRGRSQGEGDLKLHLGRMVELHVGTEFTEVEVELEGQTIGFSGQASFAGNGTGQTGTLTLQLGEGNELSGEYRSSLPLRDGFAAAGEIQGGWRRFDLALLSPWLQGPKLTGTSDGEVWARWQSGRPLQIDGRGSAVGSVSWQEQTLTFTSLQLSAGLAADQLVLEGAVELQGGGAVSLQLRSQPPRTLGWPEAGSLKLAVRDLPVQALHLKLPAGLSVAGRLGGTIAGDWRDGGKLSLQGEAQLVDGGVQWRDANRLLSAEIRQLSLAGRWQDDALSGTLAVRLGETGELNGQLQLPLPARLPLQWDETAPLSGSLQGRLVEQGLFAALFPGSIKESAGRAELNLTVQGTLQRPLLDGEVVLSGVGGYLPAAGIRIVDGGCRLLLAGQRLEVKDLVLHSGDGQLTGDGWLEWEGVEITAYGGQVQGETFLLINLPELKVVGSPAVHFSGNPKQLTLEGEVTLPEVLIRNRKSQPPKRESSDVVILDQPGPLPVRPVMALDATLRVVLGPRVRVEVSGAEANLQGEVLLRARGWTVETVTGTGQLTVSSGSYSTYGVRLDIEKGTILFAGGPIDQPTLDVLALRKAGEVKAGVRVSGTPRQPVVALYSEPAMPDTDILSYIVFGRPLGSDTSQLSLLTAAARALLARGDSATLQDTLQRRLGIDVLDVTTEEGTLESSVVTIGKYLTPDLYLSIGHGVFSGTEQLRLRYDLSRRWQLESTMGEESGADLYYKIEFR